MNEMKTVRDEDVLSVDALETAESENDNSKLDLSSLNLEMKELDVERNLKNGEDESLSLLDIMIETEQAADNACLAHCNAEALFSDTVVMLEKGEISPESGIKLLNKAGEEGYAAAYVYLGRLYADENGPCYDPSLAFGCFENAARSDSPEGLYYLGLCYINGIGCDKNPEAAFKIFARGNDRNYDECVCALAICREKGLGCETDYEEAVSLYTKAAENGSALALNNLGGCYFYGHGVLQDRARAIELYTKASELGNANATCRLGICYETGLGCERDEKTAFELYKKATENGNATAIYRLAQCYDKGIGTDQNFAKAFSYYNKAAAAGSVPAMYESGMMSKSGRGTKKSASTAYKMFYQAAELGLSDAEYEVGNCYLEGLGTVRNSEVAYLYYLRAFESDNCNAATAYRLGLCNLKGLGTEKDEKIAFEWFCRGSELGSGDAAYMKGECHFFGIGTEKDHKSAAEAFLQAIGYQNGEFSLASAYSSLAECFEEGLGVRRDIEEAMNLYKAASEAGDPRATYELGRLYMSGLDKKPDARNARMYILRAARSAYIPAMLAIGIFADEGYGVPRNASDAEKWYTKVVGATVKSSPELYDFPQRFYQRTEKEAELKIEAQYRLGMLLSKSEPSMRAYAGAFENIAFAASLGHEAAKIEISKIYLSGGDLKNYYEGASSDMVDVDANASSSVVQGNAMNKLGDAYFDGKTLLKKNEVAAARCYKISAEIGNVDGAYSYGWCLRHGVGVSENDAEAIKWLKLAADRGNVNAAYSYGLCCEEGSGTGIKNKREARSYYRKAASAGHVDAARRYMSLSSEK